MATQGQPYRIDDPAEIAFLQGMADNVFDFLPHVQKGPIHPLVQRIFDSLGDDPAKLDHVSDVVSSAILQAEYGGGLPISREFLEQNLQGSPEFLDDTYHYAEILRGVQAMVMTRSLHSLMRLEPGDRTPLQASELLRDALINVEGMGETATDLLVANLESIIDRTAAEKLGDRGRN